VVGSSAISRSGSQAVAIAIITRWPLRFGNAHQFQHVEGAALGVGVAGMLVGGQDLDDLLADLHVRGERGQRILEDDAGLRAADAAQHRRLAIAGEEADRRHEHLALARAGFADHAHDFALGDVEGRALDGMDHAVRRLEADVEVMDLKDRFRHGLSDPWDRARRAARRR